MRYPNAKVVAFEADKEIFSILKANIEDIGFDGVELIDKAVWTNEGGVNFCSRGADAGSISSEAGVHTDSVALRKYLLVEESVDFLKIDIEGAETEVILDCSDQLHRVRNIFIEFHSFTDKPQSLSALLSVLEKCGFRYYLHSVVNRKSPFTSSDAISAMDMQLNIFGFRY